MEEEPTQPSTQLVIDPRRLGQGNSGLNDEDLSDIICILHPDSVTAREAATYNNRLNPRNTISLENDVDVQDFAARAPDTFDLAARGLISCDIALRLSADLKDPERGWLFGRNQARCDFILEDDCKKVSNMHFRIYLNDYGYIMLEDTSTNGTAVDGTLLRAKEKENGQNFQHTLEHGMVITLTMDPHDKDFRFVVRIPQRNEDAQLAYDRNLADYMTRAKEIMQRRRLTAGGTARQPLNLFPHQAMNRTASSPTVVGRRPREWRGGVKYNKIGTIGKGAFAVVYKVTDKFTGVPFAAKELERRRFIKTGNINQRVDMEMKIMSRIHHDHVVRFIEHVDWEEYLYIIMEFVPGGDLSSLVSLRGFLPEETVKTMAAQLLSAVKCLHTMNITHRDIKPDNILLQSRDPIHVKLTDFGLSKMIDTEETFLRTFCGTLLYCAPEVYSEYREYGPDGMRNPRRDKNTLPPQRYDHAVDIWSLAGVLFFSLCGKPPFPVKNGTSYQELLNQIMTRALDIRPLQLFEVSEDGIRFVRTMLHTDPVHRATIADLEQSPWITGNILEMSIESVDQTAEDSVEDLKENASQLSLVEGAQVEDNVGDSDATELQPREIPSSFDTSDSSNENLEARESYKFIRNPPNNGRLFGEVNMNSSALGSSGAMPLDRLNLPLPLSHQQGEATSNYSSDRARRESIMNSSRFEDAHQQRPLTATNTIPGTMAPPQIPRLATTPDKPIDDKRSSQSSSLMGAESLVGHLQMNSPSISPTSDNLRQPSPLPNIRNGASLRRRREDGEDGENGSYGRDWLPADLPPPKRIKSARHIDMLAPVEIFWDPRDKSTHHRNYPIIAVSEYNRLKEYAQAKGERFQNGEKTFDETMQSFRLSTSSSTEQETFVRAQTDPVTEGRHQKNTHDLPGLGVEVAEKDTVLPRTARGSDATTAGTSPADATLRPVVGNDFQPPKRILAKMLATQDCCLPTIALNITESITSWGRGFANTVKYVRGEETRIPKYAFKLLLFKPGFRIPGEKMIAEPWNNNNLDNDDEFAFYISTKASSGVWINDVHLPSFDPQQPYTVSKHWGKLRHGDFITVWQKSLPTPEFMRLRFECFWGSSKQPRGEGEGFTTLEKGGLLNEIERVCMMSEKAVFEEREQKEEEEQQMKLKLKQDLARQNAKEAKTT